jgi:choline monooxygenase
MFVSDTHLPQLLPPRAYYDRDWYEAEVEHVLRPAWWPVALTHELAAEGDFITFDHVDGPVILRRSNGVVHGYRNVCAHRLAKLTGCPRGNCPTLRCQYHGWEYDESGDTRRIPDAPSFRPLEKGTLGLRTLHVEQVGEIVFLSFAADPPDIRSWLGEEADRIAHRFDSRSAVFFKDEFDLPVNWKVVVENNLESYHTGALHARTIGPCMREEACEHRFGESWSRFTQPAWWPRRGADHMAAAAGRSVDANYVHAMVHPSMLWVQVEMSAGFQSVVPTGPRSCRYVLRSLVWLSQTRRPLLDYFVQRTSRRGLKGWLQVVGEDMAYLPQVQAGIEAPVHPGPGLISRREERITHFQRWLLDRLPEVTPAAALPEQFVAATGGRPR